jgi:hypothetical protein
MITSSSKEKDSYFHGTKEYKSGISCFTENLIGSEDYGDKTEELQESGIPIDPPPPEGEDPIQHPQFSPHKPDGIQNGSKPGYGILRKVTLRLT